MTAIEMPIVMPPNANAHPVTGAGTSHRIAMPAGSPGQSSPADYQALVLFFGFFSIGFVVMTVSILTTRALRRVIRRVRARRRTRPPIARVVQR